MLASADGRNAYRIARNPVCNPQTVRNAIHKLDEEGFPETLRRGSNRPHTVHRAFEEEEEEEEGSEALREMLRRSPRESGKQSSLWATLAMAAEASFEEGLTKESASAGRPSGPPRRG